MDKRILAGAALLFCLLTEPAHAFNFTKCDGEKVVWDDAFIIFQNTVSIPVGGLREASLANAVDRWRGVDGMLNMVARFPHPLPGPSIVSGDGINDAAVVSRASIGGLNGLATMFHDGCSGSSDAKWIEADVRVANDLGFGAVEETTLTITSGRMTFLHELGHAHGLDHDQKFNHMRAMQPRPLVGGVGATIDVLPDDAKGGRFLYPSFLPEVNLFASAHLRSGNDLLFQNASGTVFFCSATGGTLTINSTVGNNGTVDVTQTERWWLSESNLGHSGGILIGQWNNSTFVANTAFTRFITLTIPPIAPGQYFLFHGVDVLKQVAESREDDNNVREALIVEVIKC